VSERGRLDLSVGALSKLQTSHDLFLSWIMKLHQIELKTQFLLYFLSNLNPVYVFKHFPLMSILILSFCIHLHPDVAFSKVFLSKNIIIFSLLAPSPLYAQKEIVFFFC
jgi:hypothetical protein